MAPQMPFSFPETSTQGWEKSADAELDTDSDDASSSEEQFFNENCSQKEIYQLNSVTPDLVQLVLNIVWVWVLTVRYTTPPDERISEQNTRKEAIHCSHNTTSKRNQKNCSESALCSSANGYYAMACPFYRLDPVRYQKCLQTKYLRNFGDVINHIGRSHIAPPSCPTCFQKFDSLVVRDRHARARICKPGAWQKPAGLNKAQKDKVEECATYEVTEKDKWYLAWNTLFPEDEPLGSPYLEYGIERRVCMARDLVSKYLATDNLIPNHKTWEDAVLVQFRRFILKIVLQRMFEQRELYEEDVGDEHMSHIPPEG